MTKGRLWTRGILALLSAAVVSVALLSGCGDDKKKTTTPGGNTGDEPTVTEAMAGIWDTTFKLKDCQSGTELFTQTFRDTLCVGESLSGALDSGTDASCTVTKNGNSYHLVCTSESTLEGCTEHDQITVDMTYTNTTLNATGQVNISYTPTGCSEGGSFCIAITGTRTGNLPSGACN
ncbi:MAG: hypothetical protein U0527_11735 [Candidatus Eisenbacteria bacterium]